MQGIRNPTQNVGQTTPSTYPAKATESSGQAEATRGGPRNTFAGVLESADTRAAKRLSSQRRNGILEPERDSVDPKHIGDLSCWFRAESPAALSESTAIRPPLRLAPQQRVLLSAAGVTPQARIQIGAGRLAGSEIHLALTGTRIEAQLLTRNETSRQTLVAAMDAVRENLRARGRVVGPASEGNLRSLLHEDSRRHHAGTGSGSGDPV